MTTISIEENVLRTVIAETVNSLIPALPNYGKIRIHPDTEYLKSKQVAILLGASQNTVDKLHRLGLLNPIRMSSRMTLYERSEILNLIKQVQLGLIEMPLEEQ